MWSLLAHTIADNARTKGAKDKKKRKSKGRAGPPNQVPMGTGKQSAPSLSPGEMDSYHEYRGREHTHDEAENRIKQDRASAAKRKSYDEPVKPKETEDEAMKRFSRERRLARMGRGE